MLALGLTIGGGVISVVGTILGHDGAFILGNVVVGCGALLHIGALVMLGAEGKQWLARFRSWFERDSMPVELINYKGISTFVLARPLDEHRYWSYLYENSRIGKVVMLANGVVDPSCESSFIYCWIPMNPQDRAQFLLSNNLPDLENIRKLDEDERFSAMHNWRTREIHNATR